MRMEDWKQAVKKQGGLNIPPGSTFLDFGETDKWDVFLVDFPLNLLREGLEEAIAQADEETKKILFRMILQWENPWVLKWRNDFRQAEAQCPFCGVWVRVSSGGFEYNGGFPIPAARMRAEMENRCLHNVDCLWRQAWRHRGNEEEE